MILLDNSSEKHVSYTYSEFVNYAKTRVRSEKSKQGSEKSRKEKGEWNGNLTFEEAIETTTTGWDSGLKQLDLTDGILTENGFKFNPSVQGSFVNIGNYLQGLPDNMWELKSESEFTLPQITIYVNLSYSSGQDGKKAIRFCQTIAGIVNEYQKNHNVRLVGLIGSTQDNDKKYLVEVVIKDYDQRFVLNNVCFAFHPSFFRRLYFAHLEGEEFMSPWGYGQTISALNLLKKVEGFRNTEKTLLMPALGDLENGSFTELDVITIKK